MKNIRDIFGDMFRPVASTSMEWHVNTEKKVYRYKDLKDFRIPAFPNSLPEMIGWLSMMLGRWEQIDRSTSNVLSHWWKLVYDPVDNIQDTWQKFHYNPQGLVQLDKWLGLKLADDRNYGHKLFGPTLKTYTLWCQ